MGIDKTILEGCIKGDRRCQQAFFDHYAPFMLAVSRRYIKAIDQAEDVVQESFIKIFNSLKNFRGDTKIDFWIRRIVINTALNNQRSKLYMFPMVDVDLMDVQTEKDFALRDFHLEDLYRFIDSLPDGCRIIFNLYAIEGYNHKEIGELLELSEGTSKSQYSRAKKLLMERIQQEKKINYERLAAK